MEATRKPLMGQQRDRLIFIDETGTTTKMTRLRGRALKGSRLNSKVPFGHWGTQTAPVLPATERTGPTSTMASAPSFFLRYSLPSPASRSEVALSEAVC